MKYSLTSARKLAQQIRDRFGARIDEATEGTITPPEFLAALISVEAGKKNGQIVENATRFEPHVYAKLKAVRDGKLLQYNKIRRAAIKDASDGALRALATSYGLTQIMGWWVLQLGISVSELRGPNHLKHAVKLLGITASDQLMDGNFEGALRIWNSGSPKGKTHDPDYVYNATKVMSAYEATVDTGLIDAEPDQPEVEPEPDVVEPPEDPTQQEPEPPGAPQAPKPEVTPVSAPSTSWTTKIAAGASAVAPVVAATGLKIGGVEFKTGGLIAISAVIIVGMVVAAWLYNESQKRRSQELQLSIANLASPDRENVIAAGSKV